MGSQTDLQSERSELLSLMLAREPLNAESKPPRYVPIERPPLLPLSHAQERLLLIHRADNLGSAWNIPLRVRLIGSLNIDALRASLTEVVRRHESLRTRIGILENGTAAQLIDLARPAEILRFDLSHYPESERVARAEAITREVRAQPFDFSVSLFRVGLIRISAIDHVLIAVVHHIVSDGWSIQLLRREISTYYNAFLRGASAPLPDLPMQFVDYVLWQKQWLEGPMMDRQLEYWVGRLKNETTLELPTDRPRPRVPSYRGATLEFLLSRDDVKALTDYAHRQQATLFMVLFAALNVMLSGWSGQRRPVIGIPVSGRRLKQVDGVIGYFINTLAICTEVAEKSTFEALLDGVRTAIIGAFAHQDLPQAVLEAKLRNVRDVDGQPLYRILFAFQNFPTGSTPIEGLQQSAFRAEATTSRRDLSVFVYEVAGGLRIVAEYAADLFNESTIELALRRFESILAQIKDDPRRLVSSLQSA